jgi:hypothetical protein
MPSPGRRRLVNKNSPGFLLAAFQRDEIAPFHQQFLPCFEAEDSTAGDLLHCGISKEPLPVIGFSTPDHPTLLPRTIGP